MQEPRLTNRSNEFQYFSTLAAAAPARYVRGMTPAIPTVETSLAERMFGNFIGQYLPGILAAFMVAGLLAHFLLGYEFTFVTALIAMIGIFGTDIFRSVVSAREKHRVRILANDPGTVSLRGNPRYPGHDLPIMFCFPAGAIGRMWTELRMLPEMEEWCAENIRGRVAVLPMPTADVAKNGVRSLKVWFEDAADREAFKHEFSEHLS